ncbi:hypothetical protein [Haloarchaeobius sp. HRN-SO-5]|uniref:hypothetical protein n=1 Tax=Haloarchaeobius sp. HRN-SO-5 TaxID=3446118 RepID=UPI003EBD4721
MNLFEIERDGFNDRFDFNAYLTESYENLSDRDLYIISGITEYSRDEFEQVLGEEGWETSQDFGAISRIRRQYSEEKSAEAYLSFDDEHGLFFLYTDQRKTEEIENGIEPFLNRTQKVHYLYLSPRILSETRERIVESEPGAKVTEFVAKRTKRTEIPAEFGEALDRTVNYYGEDGLERLRMWERELGVLPHIMQFEIPGTIKFRIDKNGVFKLQSGSLTALFEYVEECIQQSLEIADAYRESRFRMLRVSDSFNVPSSKPAVIQLRNEIDYHEIEDVIDDLEEDDYLVIDRFSEEGSLFFSGKVYDSTHNIFFNVRANQDEIRIFPKEERDIGSFYQFFEFVQTAVDERAKLTSLDA